MNLLLGCRLLGRGKEGGGRGCLLSAGDFEAEGLMNELSGDEAEVIRWLTLVLDRRNRPIQRTD
jgi:hypothetical protein